MIWEIIVKFNYRVKILFFVRVGRSSLPSRGKKCLELFSPKTEKVRLHTCLNLVFLHNCVSGKYIILDWSAI